MSCGYFPWPCNTASVAVPPVVFDWTYFQAFYPELVGVGQSFAQFAFSKACTYCDNTGRGPVPNNGAGSGAVPPNPLFLALHDLTAHICALNGSVGGVPNSTLVGRISSAAEGSVNVQAEYLAPTSTIEAWLNQTKYGAAYLASVQQYVKAIYRGAPASTYQRRWP